MEKSQALIVQIKETRERKKITYNDIVNALIVNGIPRVSLSTIRRVFANGSEDRASSFNYEETLIPISKAIEELNGEDSSPMAKELNALRNSLEFVMAQLKEKDSMIERLIDRLDQKDSIIHQFLIDMKQKDAIIQMLMEKCV